MPRLRRSDPALPGFTRRRSGKGFVYLDENGRRITDPKVIGRCRTLAIPPAWKDVWICPCPTGHLQAVGTDAKGRRQYRYHDHWRTPRAAEKFEHMIEFGRCLPKLRERCLELLADDGLSRDRVLAAAVRLLDLGFFRVGGEAYAEENDSYGLATLRREHVTLEGDAMTFDYPAKSGQQRVQTVTDGPVADVVRSLKRRRTGGNELFAYRDGKQWVDVRSEDINQFVKELSGGEFTAKDFRTWAGTVLAAVALAVSEGAATKTARKRAIARAYQEVAHYLGNTPAVCRTSYVDPRVVDRYRAGVTIAAVLSQDNAEAGGIESAVLNLLEDAPAADLAA